MADWVIQISFLVIRTSYKSFTVSYKVHVFYCRKFCHFIGLYVYPLKSEASSLYQSLPWHRSSVLRSHLNGHSFHLLFKGFLWRNIRELCWDDAGNRIRTRWLEIWTVFIKSMMNVNVLWDNLHYLQRWMNSKISL